jgi:hypothetical protein
VRCGTLEPRWTLGRIEAGSRAGAEDPRGPRSVRRRLISKERLRPYGKVRSSGSTQPGERGRFSFYSRSEQPYYEQPAGAGARST